jgi:hypothetical protein
MPPKAKKVGMPRKMKQTARTSTGGPAAHLTLATLSDTSPGDMFTVTQAGMVHSICLTLTD